ncbi:MAG: hypothetical protein AUH78_15455 [Gemmatimonadetes bacterium 13_1_40CM_4_69_8]|nr:MAG: hypothetical protein AUH78_15455 [Gemmatimonadetes bacterium 13_1_40CM_4_69_8]
MLLAGCGKDSTGTQQGVPLSSLLVLPRQDSIFAPGDVRVFVHNNLLSTFTINESDPLNTLFAAFTFAPHSIVAAGNTLVCDTCTVSVSVTLTPGQYGFTLSPAALVLNLSGEPTVSVSYGTYGDLSVYTQSPRYANPADYDQALVLYRENTPDHWLPGRNSGHSGAATVSGALETPSRYVLAAPR